MLDVSVADTIDLADFDEYERDAGTSGLCGTFALALQRVFPHLALRLVCHKNEDGEPRRCRDGSLFWRHVVAADADGLYDIDGCGQPKDLAENYCWDNSAGGCLVEVDPAELLSILKADQKSFDPLCFERWTARLMDARFKLAGIAAEVVSQDADPVHGM